MVGNLRKSFQRNVSVHHSWNRGTAVHGVHYLRLEHNFLFRIMGHAFFIEDGVEEENTIRGNLCVLTSSSNSLLNTDQTPACFWYVIQFKSVRFPENLIIIGNLLSARVTHMLKRMQDRNREQSHPE